MNITLENIDELFSYHPPATQEQLDARNAVNAAARQLAVSLICFFVPENTDKPFSLNGREREFFNVVADRVKDSDVEKSVGKAKCRFTLLIAKEVISAANFAEALTYLPALLCEIQFCRMMANHTIALAGVQADSQ